MGFWSAVTNPIKELGQEVVKAATTVGTGGTVRYDEDEGFKEGFVTKTAIRETTKALGNVGEVAGQALSGVGQVASQNPQLVDAAGMYFGVPNASGFLNRKQEPTTVNVQAPPPQVQQAQPVITTNDGGSKNALLIPIAIGLGAFAFIMFRRK